MENKLIILLNLSGSYKGGAQRRYINLFTHLQTKRDDYFLLTNKSLFDACMQDGIFTSEKNILVQGVLFEKKQKNTGNTEKVEKNNESKAQKKQSKLRNSLGAFKYFVKLLIAWMDYTIKLYSLVKKYNFKVLYGVFTGGIWSWQLARMLHLKIIYSYNDSNISMVSNSLMDFFRSEYWPLKYATKVDFLSEKIAHDLVKKNTCVQKNRTLITPNSFIDYDKFNPKYPKQDLITFNSRLVPDKNPDLFLDSLIYLSNNHNFNYKVAIIGNGRLLKDLIAKAEKCDLKFIKFYGGISNPEKIIAKSKVFISIQTENNYPSQSLLEAMACENAIIASDVGETRKLVTENEGILVNLDAEEIANAIEKLFTTPGLIEKLGKNARKKVLKEHTIEKFADYFYTITGG